MRRLLRQAFNFTAVVSAVLFLATCVLWARSHWRYEGVLLGETYRAPRPEWLNGKFSLIWRTDSNSGWPASRRWSSVSVADRPSLQSLDFASLGRKPLGFAYTEMDAPVQNNPKPWQVHFFVAPCWSLVLLSLVLPSILAVRIWRRRHDRRHKGLCPTCGYDLRATPKRCPECGVVPRNVRALPI